VIAYLLVVLLSVAVVALVAWPLVRDDGSAAPAPEAPEAVRRRELDEELERSMAAIREIEQDHRAGTLSDEDFSELDAAERARAVDLMRRRDELSGDPG
jgi:hypothetical protein